MLSIFVTFDNWLKLTMSPQADCAETGPSMYDYVVSLFHLVRWPHGAIFEPIFDPKTEGGGGFFIIRMRRTHRAKGFVISNMDVVSSFFVAE